MSGVQRLDLQYTITWLGDWHVGSGYGTALADRLIRRGSSVRNREGEVLVVRPSSIDG